MYVVGNWVEGNLGNLSFGDFYDNYTFLSQNTFNDNVTHDYQRLVIYCAGKLTRGIQQHHGEKFLHVMHDMVTLNDVNNYLGASVSFMVDFDLYILDVAFITNCVSHSSNYNADLLQKILKETFELYIYQFTKSVDSDTNNLATAVVRFNPRAVQFDCEIQQLNSCLKYGLGICENYRSKDMLDENGVVIRNSSGKKVTRKVIVTPGGSFIEGEALVKRLKALVNYFDSPQRKERLWKVQDHHSPYQGLPANTGDTRVTSTTKIFQQCLFYYHRIKLFREKIKSELDKFDGPNTKHDDKLFVTIFDAILKREWEVVQQMEAITFQLAIYAKNEAQMNRVMSSWIISLWNEKSKFI